MNTPHDSALGRETVYPRGYDPALLFPIPRAQGRAALGTRSGQPRPRAIGSFMSGGEHCAKVDPSTNWTIECTTDCG